MDRIIKKDGSCIDYYNEEGMSKFYNKKRKLHREDGPAIIYKGGIKIWYKNGQRHRIDGPAIEQINGKDCYFLYGEEYSEEDFLKHPEVITYQKLKELSK